MRTLGVSVLALAVGLSAACRMSPEREVRLPAATAHPGAGPGAPSATRPDSLPRIRLDVRRNADFTAGWSVQNRPIRYRVHGEGPEVVLVIATIHGDEPAGTPLVHRLSREFTAHPERISGQTVVVVPVANPDGLARGTRWNARGVDLNRNYPTANFRASRRGGARPLSEPESRVVAAMVERFAPRRVLSIHQPLTCVDHDGPGARLAGALAARSGLPLRKLGARPGSLGSFVGVTRGIPIITLELPAHASGQSADALWGRYGEALLDFVAGDAADR
jgi:protein MpaA